MILCSVTNFHQTAWTQLFIVGIPITLISINWHVYEQRQVSNFVLDEEDFLFSADDVMSLFEFKSMQIKVICINWMQSHVITAQHIWSFACYKF